MPRFQVHSLSHGLCDFSRATSDINIQVLVDVRSQTGSSRHTWIFPLCNMLQVRDSDTPYSVACNMHWEVLYFFLAYPQNAASVVLLRHCSALHLYFDFHSASFLWPIKTIFYDISNYTFQFLNMCGSVERGTFFLHILTIPYFAWQYS